jgi:pimeloyl-ACP methyl ester carboxylesterase
MPYTESNGDRIHYTLHGEGPLLILQHGFLSNAQSWHEAGYVDVFRRNYQVACVDSIAHGQSAASVDPARYAQARRAEDIVAVIDAVGVDTAHVLGYSMGGWIAAGVAQHAPERLSSVGIGGWDCVNGMATYAATFGVPVSFEMLIAGVRETAPELAANIDDANLAALEACFGALGDLEGNADAVCALDAPVLLWDGRDDPYHDPMQLFSQDNGFRFLSVAGDHIGAMVDDGAGNAEAIAVALTNP